MTRYYKKVDEDTYRCEFYMTDDGETFYDITGDEETIEENEDYGIYRIHQFTYGIKYGDKGCKLVIDDENIEEVEQEEYHEYCVNYDENDENECDLD